MSHEHGDHAKHFRSFADCRIPVFASGGTIGALEAGAALFQVDWATGAFKIGNFECIAFDTKHDAAEPVGFLIHHPETGTVLFATDTYYLAYTFAGLSNIMIECNYRQDILDANYAAGRVPKSQRDRTIESHMSYGTCLETLLANDLRAVNNIALIHLSDGNSNAAEFRDGIAAATGKTVSVADKGMVLQFNKTPF